MKVAVLIVPSLLLSACGDGNNYDPELSVLSDEVLGPSCGFSSCHGGGAGSLTLDGVSDHENLVGVESAQLEGAVLVVAGDPDSSYLVQKLEDAAGIEGDPMPIGGTLDDLRLEQVRAWIEEGAQDN
ncbi:MAG: hypothetical protein QGG40_05205 [Myxococcota bacterium]|jgi:hypothetical protein|nr:hypothetical protein [Myxococcota bacterium]